MPLTSARGRRALLLLWLVPVGRAVAQTGIPFAPGVVLNYSMHNYGEEADRQLLSTIVSITPDEAVFAEDMKIELDGKPQVVTYQRHQSRRELLGARTIDQGTSCNAADTTDASARGSTLRMVSQRVMRQLKTGDEVELNSYYVLGCSRRFPIPGHFRRVEPAPVPVSILLNGQRLDLQTIHVRGVLQNIDTRFDTEYWFLDDPQHAWLIRMQGRQVVPAPPKANSYLMQLGTVVAPDPDAVKRLASALEKSCRAPLYGIYFETASARLNAASAPTLQQIAQVVQQHPTWVLTIEGHTDSLGGAAKNLELSNRRAAAVRSELVGRYKVPTSRLSVKGYGLSRPIESNGTMEGRARNRRVELARACS